jgi:flagellar motor switch protein FliG
MTMAEASEELKGTEQAAVLLLTLGEEAAAAVLRHLEVAEVQRLGSAMASLTDVPREAVSGVLGNLLVAAEAKTSIGFGTADYLRKVLVASLGERKAGSLLDRIIQGRASKGIEALKWMEPKTVAQVIRNEHPQIIATILAHLSAEQGAEVLPALPAELHGDIALRIARLQDVPETALKQLDEIVDSQTRETRELRSTRLGGVRMAADIINLLDTETESAIMEAIQASDEDLGQQIQDSLFVFDNLLGLDDRGMQTLLREVQSDQLGLALRGADPALREKIFRNMSKRAAEILQDDMAAAGPVRLAEVEAAQKEILTSAQRLAEEGQIMLGGGGDDFV